MGGKKRSQRPGMVEAPQDNDELVESSNDASDQYESDESNASVEEEIIGGSSSEEEEEEGSDSDSQLSGNGEVDEDDEGVSSDEEHQMNTTGNVPMRWYDEFDHIGYDKAGKKIIRSEGMDEVDKVIASKDDPHYRRSIYDARNDENITLTDRELVMVQRMLQGKFPKPEFNAEPDYVDFYTSIRQKTPISGAPEPKRRFIPSKWERMKVLKIVNGIKAGHYKMGAKDDKDRKFYLLWGEDDTIEDAPSRRKGPRHIPAPKVAPPGHAESYHPPPEYLLDEKELKEWEEMDPEERPKNFVPKDFGILRRVPGYKNFVRERFERCLDLYLCARAEKHRLNIDPESLVPRLPLPQELRPYPTTTAVTYMGHYGRVRALAVDPSGQWLATGGDDMTVKLWEIETGRCIRTWDLSSERILIKPRPKREILESMEYSTEEEEEDKEAINKISWNPAVGKHIIACAVGRKVVLLYTGTITGSGTESTAYDAEITFKLMTGDKNSEEKENTAESDDEKSDDEHKVDGLDEDTTSKGKKADKVEWKCKHPGSSSDLTGETNSYVVLRFTNSQFLDVIDLAWHHKGDYLASVSACNARGSGQVMVHHVPKRKSQSPFSSRVKGDIQRVSFHPNKPIFFVATKTHVSIYHLVKQLLVKKLSTGAKWISSIAIHPGGDNLVVGSYDRRVNWFDLDLSSKPYKTLKYHTAAVRQVDFHPKYPLMASASDDGSIHIFHARVFDDLLQNPLIVPVKVLKTHGIINGLGVLNCAFHPTQPWLFSAGADGAVHLYQNIP